MAFTKQFPAYGELDKAINDFMIQWQGNHPGVFLTITELFGYEKPAMGAPHRKERWVLAVFHEEAKDWAPKQKMITNPALVPHEESDGSDYVLREGHSCWITVENLSVWIHPDGYDLNIDVFKHFKETDDPIGSLSQPLHIEDDDEKKT